MKRTDKYNFIDIIIVVFLVVTSGYLGVGSIVSISIPLFLVSALFFRIRKRHLNTPIIISLTIFVVLLFIQRFLWGGSFGNVLNTLLQVVSFALLALCAQPSFLKLFPKVVCVISAISLLFYIIDHTGGHSVLLAFAKNFPIKLENQNDTMDGYSFLLYVVDAGVGYRNCGPFFEPGRYAVVLCIALSMNLIRNEVLFNKENVILLLALISTVSASGIATLIFLLATRFLSMNPNRKVWMIPVLIIGALVIIPYLVNADFFGGKIANNYNNADDSNSRFGALLYLWSQIVDSPWFGYGPTIYLIERFDVANVSSPNGWGELMRFWGIPMSLVYLICYLRFADANGYHNALSRLMSFFGIWMVAFSQSVMLTPLYYVLFFIGVSSFTSVKQPISYHCQSSRYTK